MLSIYRRKRDRNKAIKYLILEHLNIKYKYLIAKVISLNEFTLDELADMFKLSVRQLGTIHDIYNTPENNSISIVKVILLSIYPYIRHGS